MLHFINTVTRVKLGVFRVGLLLAVATILIMALAACSSEEEVDLVLKDIARSPDTPIVIPAGEPVVVGVSTALTGPVGGPGTEYRDAVVASVERWKAANGKLFKGHEIEVQSEDDGCTQSDITKVAAQRLLSRQGLVGVIGPQCSAGTEFVRPIYAQAGIVAISGSTTRTDLTVSQPSPPFFFRTAYRNDLQGFLIGTFLVSTLQVQNVYLIGDSEPYGEDLLDVVQPFLIENDVRVVRSGVRQGDVDFSDLAAGIAAGNPDFVGFAGFNPEATLLYRQLRDAGYSGLYGSTDAAASVQEFIEPLGDLSEGVVFSGCRVKLPDDFVNDFIRIHGHEPGTAAFTGHYADATWILLDTVASVAQEQLDGSLVIEPLVLRDAVNEASLENGITGSIAFEENGDRVPNKGDSLSDVIQAGTENQDTSVYVDLGLIPCQVQDGALVNLLGPGAGEFR